MLSSMVDIRSDKRAFRGVVGTMELMVFTLMSVGSPRTSYCTPEGSKVGRHHGDVDGSASHSEQHNTTM